MNNPSYLFTNTRFYQEISGKLGDWWKSHAEQEAMKLRQEAEEKANVDEDGAASWKSNGSYFMDDLCEKLFWAGFRFSPEATHKKREEQNAAFINEYRKQKHVLSKENLAEARNAFGAGTKMVDIISGEVYQL